MAQNAIPKEACVKYAVAVLACLVLGLAATPASAGAIRNPGFTNLDYWAIYYEGTNWSTPGTVTWEGPGSVLLEAIGGPGTIGLAQPTCESLNVGDSAWVDGTVLSASNTTFGLFLGDAASNGQYADLVNPSGPFHLVIYANKQYPQGTWYSFRGLTWPGSFSIRVNTANASLLEEERAAAPTVGPAMDVSPNPATGRSRVSFNVPQSWRVRLAIYDAAGNLVRNVERRLYSAGQHSAVWNGRDESGHSVSAGSYLVRLTTENGRQQTASVIVTR